MGNSDKILKISNSLAPVEIYTDGGCSGNPGPGGWAFMIVQNPGGPGVSPAIIEEKWGAEPATTNNRMELQAVISALEALPSAGPGVNDAILYTDSQYVQKGMTQWLEEWKKRGWKTSGKKPVKNRDLWERLDALVSALAADSGLSLKWAWVRGHDGNAYNERCDALTGKAIASLA